jgi:hypothetical protein
MRSTASLRMVASSFAAMAISRLVLWPPVEASLKHGQDHCLFLRKQRQQLLHGLEHSFRSICCKDGHISDETHKLKRRIFLCHVEKEQSQHESQPSPVIEWSQSLLHWMPYAKLNCFNVISVRCGVSKEVATQLEGR